MNACYQSIDLLLLLDHASLASTDQELARIFRIILVLFPTVSPGQ